MADGSPPPLGPMSPFLGTVPRPPFRPGTRTVAWARPPLASRRASPDPQGRVMDQHSAMVSVFVGIDVAKDRLDVHPLPSGEGPDQQL